jgi:hypothetical protein
LNGYHIERLEMPRNIESLVGKQSDFSLKALAGEY